MLSLRGLAAKDQVSVGSSVGSLAPSLPCFLLCSSLVSDLRDATYAEN